MTCSRRGRSKKSGTMVASSVLRDSSSGDGVVRGCWSSSHEEPMQVSTNSFFFTFFFLFFFSFSSSSFSSCFLLVYLFFSSFCPLFFILFHLVSLFLFLSTGGT